MKIYHKIQKEDWILIGKDELVTLDKLLKCYRVCQKMWLEVKKK